MLSDRKIWELINQYRSKTRDSRLSGTFLTVENIMLCLDLFGNLTECFGVFKEIMNELKCDLTEAMFSYQLTANKNEQENTIERIPYFLLYQNLVNIQKAHFLNFEESKENLNKEILSQQEHIAILKELNIEKENKCLSLENEIISNKNEISRLLLELRNINYSKIEIETSMQDIIDKMSKENHSLKKELYHENTINSNLQIYKDSHDHLDKSFMEACLDNAKDGPPGDSFNKKSNLEMEMKTIITMDNDLITLENLLINDFDKRLFEFKQKIMDYKYVDENESDISYSEDDKTDVLIANAIMDLNKCKLHFQNEFTQLQIESIMLQDHQTLLINDWSLIEEAEMENKSNILRDVKASFIIDNRVMSKYSAIIYISNDGINFYECKDTRFCESCGNKNVFCPHSITKKEKVIKLPQGSQYIKIQRPEMKLISKYAKYFSTKSSVLTDEALEIMSSKEKIPPRELLRESLSKLNDPKPEVSFTFLLEDFKNRTNVNRIMPRHFDEFKILSIIEDFWASLLNEDQYDTQQSEITSVLDKLYLFFLDRYGHDKAAMLSLYDFFLSLNENSAFSQIVGLFCHALIGNIDNSVIRYLFHLIDCIEIVEWTKEENLRTFIEIVYPFLNDDDVDSFVLSYISFSENVFNQDKMLEYLINMLLTRNDPRFIWIKSEALSLKTAIPGLYTFKEFQLLLELVTSVPNFKLSIRLFKELAICYSQEPVVEMAPGDKVLGEINAYVQNHLKILIDCSSSNPFNFQKIVGFLSFLESVENTKQMLRVKFKDISKNKKKIRWSFSRLFNLASKILRDI